MAISELQVQTVLKEVKDPNTQTDFFSSKSVRNIKIDGNDVSVDVVLAYPAKSVMEELRALVADKLKTIAGVGKVTVNIPVRLMKAGLGLGRRLTPTAGGIDWDELQAMLTDGREGMLIEVQDEESGEHVQIYVD